MMFDGGSGLGPLGTSRAYRVFDVFALPALPMGSGRTRRLRAGRQPDAYNAAIARLSRHMSCSPPAASCPG